MGIEGHATEPKIDLSGLIFTELTGGCGQLEIKSGIYKIEDPKPLWVQKVAL